MSLKPTIIRSIHPAFFYRVYLPENDLSKIKEATEIANKITEKLLVKGSKGVSTAFLNLTLMKKYEEAL